LPNTAAALVGAQPEYVASTGTFPAIFWLSTPDELRRHRPDLLPPDGSAESKFMDRYTRFCIRWCLTGLTTWDLPQPQGPLLPCPGSGIPRGLGMYFDTKMVDKRSAETIRKYEGYRKRYKKFFLKIGVEKVTDITVAVVDKYRAARFQDGAGDTTVYLELVFLRSAVNYALSRELILDDPLKGLRMPKAETPDQPYWTPEQAELIIAKANGIYRLVFIILWETGMRAGEVLHLAWGDVDQHRGVVHIRAKDGWKPKNGKSRSITITPRMKDTFDALRGNAVGNWVFSAKRSVKNPGGDQQLSMDTLRYHLGRALKKSGMTGKLHSFRHSFISHALTRSNPVPEAVLQEIVGQVDKRIIKRYTHIADRIARESMQRLAAAKVKVATDVIIDGKNLPAGEAGTAHK
jgi:integrase